MTRPVSLHANPVRDQDGESALRHYGRKHSLLVDREGRGARHDPHDLAGGDGENVLCDLRARVPFSLNASTARESRR
jgi:hypothetical protein